MMKGVVREGTSKEMTTGDASDGHVSGLVIKNASLEAKAEK